tara:strand:- start:383 stop:1663 length:1281 start_codon:yes stop_codon:yes gene_type:complete
MNINKYKLFFYSVVIVVPILAVSLFQPRTDVEIYGPYFGFEEEYLQKELDIIGKDLNLSIKYFPIIDVETHIVENYSTGDIPDIAIMPNPQGVTNLGERSIAIPIESFIQNDYLFKIYPQHLIDITTSLETGINYGAWLRLFPNSLIWYNVPKFEKIGSPEFNSYNELLLFTNEISERGKEPWCLDSESGVASGWITTNWVEDLLLATYGPEVYDDWWKLKIEASSNTMLSVFLDLGSLTFGSDNVYGGNLRLTSKEFINLPKALMDEGSPCIFTWMGHFLSVYFPEEYSFSVDYNFFLFPSEKYKGSVVGIGDSIVLLSDDKNVINVFERLMRRDFGNYWMQQLDATFIPANMNSDISQITNPLTVKEANIIRHAQSLNLFKYDASELMSRPIGSDKLWDMLTRYMQSGYLASIYKLTAELDTHY